MCLQTCCRFENVSGKVDFMGRGFTSGGQEPWSVFSASVSKIRASKCYVESLPLVLKDKRSCFSQVKGSLYSIDN